MLEQVLHLMHCSPHHRAYTVDTVLRCVAPPLHLDQSTGIERDGQLMAWASWAWMTPDKAEAFLKDKYKIQPDDWRSGERLVIMDFIAPFGDARTLHRTLRNLFATVPSDILPGATWVRFAKHGKIGAANNGQR